ncbi:MAG: hypothetical protein IKU61_00530, partial [Clostridia bacterium]|nr:hypothetical protein [Clostridia bacterium]
VKKEAQRIAPVNVSELGNCQVSDFRSSSDSPNGYMIIFERDKAKRAVLFDANKRIINNLRHVAPSIVTLSDSLPEE